MTPCNMIYLILVTIVAICPPSLATTFDQCNDKRLPQPLAVRISNCTKPPCDLIRSAIATMEIDFEAVRDLTDIKTVVQALALGVETNYPLPNDDVCSSLTDGECPLDAGEVVTYKLQMPVLESYPKVHVIIQFSLVSELDTIACFKVSANVVDP